MKHKYTFTISEVAVKKDTPQLVAAVVKRHKCELLGSRRDKSNDMQFGVSAEPKAAKLIYRDLSMTNNGEVLMKDHGEDDGKRKSKPTEAVPAEPKPAPKPVQRARPTREAKAEREPVCPGIPPTSEQFKKWDDIGSPAHERGVKLLGAGCEVHQMKWWGKFSIDRDALYAVLYNRLKDDAEFKKYTEANMCRPQGFVAYVATNWVNMRPFVYKAFSKEDAQFIEWHTTHSGRRPDNV